MSQRPLPPGVVPDLLLGTSRHALIAYVRITSRVLTGGEALVADTVAHEVDGVEYAPVPFQVAPLPEGQEGQPALELRLPNIGRAVGEALRRAGEDTRVTIEWRSMQLFDLSVVPRVPNGPDHVLMKVDRWRVLDITDADAESVSLRLSRPDITQEPVTVLRATPDVAPGLWLS